MDCSAIYFVYRDFAIPITLIEGKWYWVDCTELDSSFTSQLTLPLPTHGSDKCAEANTASPNTWTAVNCDDSSSYPFCLDVDENKCTYNLNVYGKELCIINKKVNDYSSANSKCNNLQYNLLEENSAILSHLSDLCFNKDKTDEDM